MKKKYTSPRLYIVSVALQNRLLVDSYKINNVEIDADAMVKGDCSNNSGSSSPSYNVWDDDWSR